MNSRSISTRVAHPWRPLRVACLSALVVGVLAQFGLSERNRDLLVILGMIVLVSLALFHASRRAYRSDPEARGWQLISLFLVVALLLQLFRLPEHFEVGWSFLHGPFPFILSLVGSTLQAFALARWQLSPRTRFERLRHGLDGLLFALAVFFVLWVLVLGPLFLSDQFPVAVRLVWLATFLVYDLLLGLTLYLGLSDPARFRGPLGWLAAAFMLASLLNLYILLGKLAGAVKVPDLPGGVTFALPLAYLAAALSPHPVGSRSSEGEPPHLIHLVPYLPVLGATILGMGQLAFGSGEGHQPVLVWLALALVLVLLVRQYLALRDYSILSRTLEARVAERTQALEQAQALLLRTERMNSLATLGAGLAHDMNNMLSAIHSRAELVIMDLDEGRLPDRKDLLRVQEATQLAAALSGRLMALGRQEAEPPRLLDLGEELLAIQPLLQMLLPGSLTLRLDSTGPMPFLGTRGMLEQILVNLVGNARDAMPSGGVITLRGRAPRSEEGPVGPLLEIEDTGTGIPEELQSQVFQPFFTTKAPGIGTGLGLTSVKSLLEKAGGSIQVASRAGQGTTFQIRLPYAAEGI